MTAKIVLKRKSQNGVMNKYHKLQQAQQEKANWVGKFVILYSCRDFAEFVRIFFQAMWQPKKINYYKS